MSILIALGANLTSPDFGSPKETLTAAGIRLGMLGVDTLACSRWYRSPAWPASEQPDYVNGVIRVATAAKPPALLGILQRVEEEFGRVRTVRNAARVLDLDLLAYDRQVIRTTDDRLILPHPRMRDRPFVLLPLADVAPDWVHPATGESIRDLLGRLDLSTTVPLEAGRG